MNKTRRSVSAGVVFCAAMMSLAACTETPISADSHEEVSPPTNRIDIPEPVRRNLGITFARAEYRPVSTTMRLPGRFELLPTAKREYRAVAAGRVEILVEQYQQVEPGMPLYRLDSSLWSDLRERMTTATAKAESMVVLREAHRIHETALVEKVQLWKDRLQLLEDLHRAGGGTAAEVNEARVMLNATQADLAEVMEKDAALDAEQKQMEAELRSLASRMEYLGKLCGCDESSDEVPSGIVCARESGVVQFLGISQGGLIGENELVLTTIQPDLVRFIAKALQSDLARLRDGLDARIYPPGNDPGGQQSPIHGLLKLGLHADATERTLDVLIEFQSGESWARPGMSAQAEIVLQGGQEELAVPLRAIVKDGLVPVLFRRDPVNRDRVIRLEADTGINDGRWVVIQSGLRAGDEIVVEGNYQLMLAGSGSTTKGGHFHADGTWHAEDH